MGVASVGLAKTTPPAATGRLPRSRLFELLDGGPDPAIFWVSGPAGSGKTALVASYLEARNIPVLWYHVDGGDVDLPSFFHFLALATESIAPLPDRPLPRLTPDYLLGVPQFSRNFFSQVFERLPDGVALVFDNLHEVGHDAPLHEALLAGISRRPVSCRFLLISRSEAPPAYARLKANHTLGTLGWKDLRLTPQETDDIVQLHRGDLPSQEVLRWIHEAADGWVAGLQLMLEGARWRGLAGEALAALGREQTFDYFASQIFGRLDEDTQHFLLKTSLLPWMSVESAEALSGNPAAGRILSRLHRDNHFTEKRTGAADAYRYHDLFRAFLHRMAEETYPGEELERLREAAAGLLEAEGQVAEAVHLLEKARRWKPLCSLILREAPNLMGQARQGVLGSWIDGLPGTLVEADPWLLYWRGKATLFNDPPESRALLELALARFRQQDNAEGCFATWTDIITTYAIEFADFVPVDRWIQVFEDLRRRYPALLPPVLDEQVALAVFSARIFRQPGRPETEQWENRVEVLTRKSLDPYTRVSAASKLVLYYSWLGLTAKALRIAKMMQPQVFAEGIPLGLRLEWIAHDVGNVWLAGNFDEALEIIAKGLKLGEISGVRVFDSTLSALGTWASVARGDLPGARRFLQRMRVAIPHHRLNDTARWHYVSALVAAEQGDCTAALQFAESALGITSQTGFPFPQALCNLALGQLHGEQGDHARAEAHIGAAERIGSEMASVTVQHGCLLFRSQWAFAAGDEEEGRSLLGRALRLGREHGFFICCWWRRAVMFSLCTRALEAGIEVPYVQELIRRCRFAPASSPVEIERWPWRVKVFTLGHFDIHVDGNSLRSAPDWRRKTLHLLKALIALGGRNVQEWQLVDALWPDADGDLAHRSFATTLYRLRKLLGVPEALHLRGGRLSLDDRYVWVDVWALERVIEKAQDASPRKATQPEAEWRRIAEKIAALYKGPFLGEDGDQPWSFQRRERLRSRFLSAIRSCGMGLERFGQREEAAALYRTALEAEPSAEEIGRTLFACQAPPDQDGNSRRGFGLPGAARRIR
jgi:DNA-binding SARP family transcriptional activator